MFQNELWDHGYGDAVVDTTVTVEHSARTRRRRAHAHAEPPHDVGTITITGTRSVDADDDPQLDHVQDGRPLSPVGRAREPAQSLRVEPVSARGDRRAAAVRQREERQHRRHRGAAARSARRARASTTSTSCSSRRTTRATTCFGGARRLDVDGTVGNLFARSLAGARHLPRRRGGRAATANVVAVPPADVQREHRLQAAGVPAAAGGRVRRRRVRASHHQSRRVHRPRLRRRRQRSRIEIAPRAPVSLNYRYELNRVEASDVYFCVNFGVCDTLTIGALRSHQSLSPLTLTGFIDRSDLPFSPTKGYVARLDFEHASALTLSDYRYNRVFFDAAAYGAQERTRRTSTRRTCASGVVRRARRPAPTAACCIRASDSTPAARTRCAAIGENQLGPRILTIDDSTLDHAARRSVGGGTCAPTVDAVKFCDPNSPKLVNAATSSRSRSAARRCSREASSTAFPLPLGPTLRAFRRRRVHRRRRRRSGDIRGLQTLEQHHQGHGRDHAGLRHSLRVAGRTDPRRLRHQSESRREPRRRHGGARQHGHAAHRPARATAELLAGPHAFSTISSLHFSIGEAY